MDLGREEGNKFILECSGKSLFKQNFIIEFYKQNDTKKAFAGIMISFIAMAIGPKHLDLEIVSRT